jgi:hypothetical protein
MPKARRHNSNLPLVGVPIGGNYSGTNTGGRHSRPPGRDLGTVMSVGW